MMKAGIYVYCIVYTYETGILNKFMLYLVSIETFLHPAMLYIII